MQPKTKEYIIQFFKFLFFSLGAGIIQMVSFAILNEFTNITYWGCYLPSLILSVLFNFTVNKAYTFKSADNVTKCMFLVFLFYVFFTPLSTLLGAKLEKYMNEYLLTFLIMVLNFILEFLYNRYVVYKKTINTKK